MQFIERYEIGAIDPSTYTILDRMESKNYVAMINAAMGSCHNVQITLAAVGTTSSDKYLAFLHEVYIVKYFAVNWDHAISLMTGILSQVNTGVDVSNPVELSALFGGEVLGKNIKWPPTKGLH